MSNPIIRRLFENKQVLNTSFFDAKDHSDEAYELHDTLDSKVKNAVSKLFDDVDVDDTGLDSSRYGGDCNISYIATVARFEKKTFKYRPLRSKERELLEKEVMSSLILPKEDDKYDYEVRSEFEGTTLKIRLSRKEKW